MLGRAYDGQICSIASTLEIVGERWTLLVLRDAFQGVRRFDDFQRSLGVARNVLQSRLERLIDEGVLERRLYQERPPRYEYRLTEKGIDFWPALMMLMKWGDRHAYPTGPPVLVEHRDCGGEVDDHLMCTRCGARLGARDARVRPGPSATPEAVERHPALKTA